MAIKLLKVDNLNQEIIDRNIFDIERIINAGKIDELQLVPKTPTIFSGGYPTGYTYYDKALNTILYWNGTAFVAVGSFIVPSPVDPTLFDLNNYLFKPGKAGGQSIFAGTLATDSLIIKASTHAVPTGSILIQATHADQKVLRLMAAFNPSANADILRFEDSTAVALARFTGIGQLQFGSPIVSNYNIGMRMSGYARYQLFDGNDSIGAAASVGGFTAQQTGFTGSTTFPTLVIWNRTNQQLPLLFAGLTYNPGVAIGELMSLSVSNTAFDAGSVRLSTNNMILSGHQPAFGLSPNARFAQKQGTSLTLDFATVTITGSISGYQPLDTDLTEIAALANTSGHMLYTNATDNWALLPGPTGAGQTLLSSAANVFAWAAAPAGYTDEEAQDAVGNILMDSISILWDYDDVSNLISAVVDESGLDLNSIGGTLSPVKGGTGLSTIAVGDLIYGSAINVFSRLAGNILTGTRYLRSIGDGVNATAPAWAQIKGSELQEADIPDNLFRVVGSATPSKKLAFEVDGFTASTTRTWTPGNYDLTFSTTAPSPGSIDYGSAANVLSTLAGNTTATKMFLSMTSSVPLWGTISKADVTDFPHKILSASHSDVTVDSIVLGDLLYVNATPAWTRHPGNVTAVRQFLAQTGDGLNSAAPVWTTITAAMLPAHTHASSSEGGVLDLYGALADNEVVTSSGGWTFENGLAVGSLSGYPQIAFTDVSYTTYIGPSGLFGIGGITTDNRNIEFPDFSGIVVLTAGAQTIASKTMSTTANTLRANTISSGVAFEDNTSTTKKLRFILSGAAAANHAISIVSVAARTYTFGDDTGHVDLIVAPASATVDKTGQTASIGATTVYTTVHAGFYRMSAYWVFTAVTLAGSLAVSAKFTDPQQAQTEIFINAAAFVAAGDNASGDYVFYATSGSTIQFTTTLVNTGTYNVYIRVESLT